MYELHAVEGQQTHHQHPKVGQLTPPLYSKQHVLCLKLWTLDCKLEELHASLPNYSIKEPKGDRQRDR